MERLEKWAAVVRSWHPAFYDFVSAYLDGRKGIQTLDDAIAGIRAEYERQDTKGFDYPNQEDEYTIIERLLWLALLRAALRKLTYYVDKDGVGEDLA
jgi:hypothetical protein